MKVAIMQPYFFPYLGHFSLISQVEKWVVFDVSQYTKRSWMNRNRIANRTTGTWSYINLPVKRPGLSMKTYEARLDNVPKAIKKFLGALHQYKNCAPYYDDVMSIIETPIRDTESDFLVDFNINCLASVCDYLDIRFDYVLASQMDIDYSRVHDSGQWALEISKYCCADTYLNPITGSELFDAKLFQEAGIKLDFFQPETIIYECRSPFNYVPNLSIIDVLMWSSKEDIIQFIANE